jgi:nucleoside-diphosphate-sugar epimerase
MHGTPAARILIAGAGYVGGALAALLAGDGHTVWALRRSPAGLPRGVRPFAADLSVRASLERLPPGLDYVFYTAAPDHGDEAGYRAAYVDGLGNLLAVLERSRERPRRILFTSSTAVYAQQEGEWVDEESPTEPRGYAGRLLLEAERLLADSPFPSTSVRLGGIYGPGRTRLLDQVASGAATCPPGGVQWSNRIHRDDCAGVLRHLISAPSAAGLYLGVDREPAPLCHIMRWIARRLGRPDPPIAAAEAANRAGRDRSNKRCSSARLVDLGFTFHFPTYREGFGALIADRESAPVS